MSINLIPVETCDGISSTLNRFHICINLYFAHKNTQSSRISLFMISISLLHHQTEDNFQRTHLPFPNRNDPFHILSHFARSKSALTSTCSMSLSQFKHGTEKANQIVYLPFWDFGSRRKTLYHRIYLS